MAPARETESLTVSMFIQREHFIHRRVCEGHWKIYLRFGLKQILLIRILYLAFLTFNRQQKQAGNKKVRYGMNHK